MRIPLVVLLFVATLGCDSGARAPARTVEVDPPIALAGFQKPAPPPDKIPDAKTVKKQMTSAQLALGDPIVNSIGMLLVPIPAGQFQMGSPDTTDDSWNQDEAPQHLVKITKPFYLGAFEVTVRQFREFVQAEKYETEIERDEKGGYGYSAETKKFENIPNPQYNWKNVGWPQNDDHPVVNVTWNDAVEFCRWLTEKEGSTYRLPSEAEWEYACRAGTQSVYSSGDDVTSLRDTANIADTSVFKKYNGFGPFTVRWDDRYPFTATVGQFNPNRWGLRDMHGNVFEWCSDYYAAAYYKRSPKRDPPGPSSGLSHVIRGGSFVAIFGMGNVDNVRSAKRRDGLPYSDDNPTLLICGFRAARTYLGN